VNAAEQATNLTLASKIASVVSLFRSEFPDAKVDLQPWAKDRDTQELVDPDSIDLSFHFPGWSPKWQSRSLLLQMRFYRDPVEETSRFIGLELAGFDRCGEQWRLSTIDNWQLTGNKQPRTEIADKLKKFCRQIFELFGEQ
jgi:hypothetical protein